MKSLCMLLLCICFFVSCSTAETTKPNVVIIFLDDAGWGDFRPFAKTPYPTPHVESLAASGTRYTQFYVPQAVCSASRSVLLSGCYPGRTKVFGAHGPNGHGLDPKFATMAEMLKGNGYATAHYGKWHCGDKPETRPLARGFEKHAGLMYSNDMWRFHPVNPKHWGKFPLQFWDNGKVKIEDVSKNDQKYLTKWATENSVNFIKENKDKPFFVYMAHSMPHVPLFCSPEFEGKSGAGLYGDVIMEIDWSVGQIEKALKEAGVADNTIIIFSSDNGPWIVYGERAGKTPFREAKGTSFDGGIRSPLIVKFPGKIKAGATSETAFCTVDMLPTIAHLTGSKLPQNEIDGKNVWNLMTGESSANPHVYYPFSNGRNFEGVISGNGKWKFHIPHGYRSVATYGKGGFSGTYKKGTKIGYALFDMKNDPYEKNNVIDKYPEVAAKMKALAEKHKAKFYSKK